jgi:hypothetical protein
VAFDEQLAERVRGQLVGESGLVGKAMFGGLAFLLDGDMAVGLTGNELMVRVGPDRSDAALGRPHTRPFDMTGRPMKGWILVAPDALGGEQELADWVSEGVAFARTLPPKKG